MALHDSAMLVSLVISQWTARRFDRKVTEEVNEHHQASNAGRFNKLLIDRAHLQPIQRVVSEARAKHYTMTLPWSDTGYRLLPTTSYFRYMEVMAECRARFQTERDQFVRNYQTYVKTARTHLGSLYDPTEYPSDVESLFSFDFAVTPVPDKGDFRVNVTAEELKKLQEQLERQNQEHVAAALRNCWERIEEVVMPFLRLKDEKAIFRDSLVGNVNATLETLESFRTIVSTPELASVVEQTRSLCHPPEALRNNFQLRSSVVQTAEHLLRRIERAKETG